MYLQEIETKIFFLNWFFVGILRSKTKIAGSGSASGSDRSTDPDPDPDPHQNVMDPQHCFIKFLIADISPCFLFHAWNKPG